VFNVPPPPLPPEKASIYWTCLIPTSFYPLPRTFRAMRILHRNDLSTLETFTSFTPPIRSADNSSFFHRKQALRSWRACPSSFLSFTAEPGLVCARLARVFSSSECSLVSFLEKPSLPPILRIRFCLMVVVEKFYFHAPLGLGLSYSSVGASLQRCPKSVPSHNAA